MWGSFEFLAKAAINVTDSEDVYGCNYDVFAGNDIARGSHKKLRRFMPAKPMPYYEAKELLARCLSDNLFAEGIAAKEVEFTEVVLGVNEMRRVKIA